MTQTRDPIPAPTRRTLLAGALGGLAAIVAGALGRPRAAAATDGDAVKVGQAHSGVTMTSFTNSADSDVVLGANSTGAGIGIQGISGGGFGIFGGSYSNHGVRGESEAAAKSGVFGWNSGGGTGLTGTSGGSAAIPQPAKTGIYGFASQDAAAVGVYGESGAGTGVLGESTWFTGVRGYTTSGIGVHGSSASGTGVAGDSTSGPGVHGSSSNAAGVVGQSVNDSGVYGESVGYVGVKGASESDAGVRGNTVSGTGVWGGAAAESGGTRGVFGMSLSPGGTGVQGYSGNQALPSAAPNTGVFGRADRDSGSRGVFGSTNSGRGVYGTATTGQGVRGYTTGTSGTAGFFSTPVDSGTSIHKGTALLADGRVKFPNCAGVALIAPNTKTVVVTPGIDLTSSSAVVATLMGSAGGTTNIHRVAVNATAKTFTIVLTANSTAASNVKVAWHVFG